MTSLQRQSCIILRSLNIESGGKHPGAPDRKAARQGEFYVFLRAKTIDDSKIANRTRLDELKRKGVVSAMCVLKKHKMLTIKRNISERSKFFSIKCNGEKCIIIKRTRTIFLREFIRIPNLMLSGYANEIFVDILLESHHSVFLKIVKKTSL